MTLQRLSLPFLIFILVFTSCSNKKEKELDLRENALLEREKKFSDKEAQYELLLKMKDSLFSASIKKDSISKIEKWPDSLGVSWNSKLICRESSCGSYVIGDQRSEVWEFVSDSAGLYANVINGKELKRVLRAKYMNNKIVLDSARESASNGKMKINVVLDDIKKNIIKGTQTITGNDNCTAKFSVELTPSNKK